VPRTFVLSGLASPQLLMRALGYFAQRDLLPDAVTLATADGSLRLEIVQAGLDDRQAAVLLERLRALPEAAAVTLDGA
jgi:hypothetical protein